MKIRYFLVSIVLLMALAYAGEFTISTGASHQKHSEIVFDGTMYRVVYDSVGDIWCAEVTPEGAVASKVRLTSSADPDSTPSIAFDGTNFFIVWTRYSSTFGAIMNQNSQIISGPFMVQMNGKFHPVIAFTNNRFLIVASYQALIPNGVQGVLEGILYNTSYVPVGNYFRIAETPYIADYLGSIGHAAIGVDGTKFMIAYPYSIATPPNYPYQNILSFRFVTTTGSVGSEVVIRSVSGMSTSHDTLLFYPSDIAYNGTKYCIVYHFAESGSSNGAYSNLYGRIVNTDGSWGSNEFVIAGQTNINECAGAIAAEDKYFVITWQDYRAGNYNLYRKYYTESGTAISGETSVTTASNNQILPQVASDGLNNLVVWQDYRSNSHWDIYGNLLANFILTDDQLALAYNGNRHLVRKPNTNEFHMVYTRGGKVVYRYSSNQGVEWPRGCTLGTGKFPSIALSAAGLAHIAWTDDNGGLWFRYQTNTNTWSPLYDLSPPVDSPRVNSPPSIGLVVNRGVVYPHILVTRTGQGSGNVQHRVEDFSFPVTDPKSGSFEPIEEQQGPPTPILRRNPSITKDDTDTLHAVWQRGTSDYITYAKRYRIGTWDVWGVVFGNEGSQSAHPFPEAYGNKIYCVWQSKYPYGIEEIYLASRYHGQEDWTKSNMSQTPSTKSFYASNASGFFTVWADEHNSPWDIYYKVQPEDPLYYISQTPGVISQYPHSCMKYGTSANYLYTIWLEGNTAPYQVMFKKSTYIAPPDFAYISSPAGQSSPSPYLISRDGYNSNGQIPVDYGYQSLRYRFPLLPDYIYKLKTVLYFEGSGSRSARIRAGDYTQVINYNAGNPKTVELLIPPQLYQDSILEITLEKLTGTYVSAGPIEIYRYEYETGGGPQDVGTLSINPEKPMLNIYPNPGDRVFTVKYAISCETPVNLSLYDATGRLVRVLVNEIQKSGSYQRMLDLSELAQGIYFVRLNADNQTTVQKLILLR